MNMRLECVSLLALLLLDILQLVGAAPGYNYNHYPSYTYGNRYPTYTYSNPYASHHSHNQPTSYDTYYNYYRNYPNYGSYSSSAYSSSYSSTYNSGYHNHNGKQGVYVGSPLAGMWLICHNCGRGG